MTTSDHDLPRPVELIGRPSTGPAAVTQRILVLGGDGFLGWPTAMHLSAAGHVVGVVDNGIRRRYDAELGTASLVPISPLATRVHAWHSVSSRRIMAFDGDLTDPAFTRETIEDFRPDTIVHFAEQRSAPYSMIDQAHAVHTQVNNVVGTLNVLYAIAQVDPDIHLVKLGTMGEYGTPNIDIEEGWLEVTHKGRTDRMLYPKRPGSFYHLSKVHDSHNIEFACRAWGLRATDLNQGIVYGVETGETVLDPRLPTRFDYDEVFGTVLNRMVAQAVVGEPLTVYGTGEQRRGMIDIRDTVECIRLASEHPAEPGEFRVFNQFTESPSVSEIAHLVARVFGDGCEIGSLANPRVEAESHYYNAAHERLEQLGLSPHHVDDHLIRSLLDIAETHRDRIDRTKIHPTVSWRSVAPALTAAGIAADERLAVCS
jgi:UDP-sulfoquinovose synthase